ncbi:hypothetical protein B0H21DRAFT_811274 [Amylocystis lapponica]|nr:hypothetical protein B0H21DRAFT_811274 [Amylocystis lapponica]
MPWTSLPYSIRCLRSSVRPTPRSFSFTPNQRLAHYASHIPSFREQVARTSEVKSFSKELSRPSVRNQVLFVVGTTVVVYCVAARWTNTDTFYWSNVLQTTGSAWQTRPPSNDEMRRARYFQYGKVLQTRLALVKDAIDEWPQTLRAMVIWSYIQVAQPILDASEGRRMCWAIGAVNTLVWLAWQFPRLQPAMARHFVHSPLSGRSYTLFTSMFSHRNIFHLLATSMVLSSFANVRDPRVHSEVAPFIVPRLRHVPCPSCIPLTLTTATAGLFSGLTSHIAISRITFPRLVSRLSASARATTSVTASSTAASTSAAATSAAVRSSQGVTGAVYAAFTLTALAYPDTELAMAIPPTFPIPIQGALGAALAVDVLGIWRGWRRFNHWAHLGGAAYGAWYWAWGYKMWGAFREGTLGSLPRELSNRPAQA